MISAQKVFNGLFQGLSPRQKDVLMHRFGLSGGETKTLAALGEQYGVTRERIRQIEASALGILKKKIAAHAECAQIFAHGKKHLQGFGGVARCDTLLAHYASVAEGLKENHLALLLEAAAPFSFSVEDEHFRPFYYLEKGGVKKVSDFVLKFVKFLRGKKTEILNGGYEAQFRDFVKHEKIDPRLAEHYLAISKRVGVNQYGDKGLAEWPEIKPRTIRDRVYLILKKKGEPLHFRAIADLINKAGLGGRKALAPTVHNELIKDKRFVLVGRGMYALAEQGYEPGTAKEIIKKILKREGPLTPQSIILAVQKERLFKANTVLANLQNKNLFERREDGAYRVREA